MNDKFLNNIFKEGFKAKYNGSKLVNNLANYGGNKGSSLFVNRNGEYNGIIIELEERVYPLFTDNLVHSIYLNIESNYTDNIILIDKFGLINLYQKYSNELFRFIVDEFLIINNCKPIYSNYPKIISNINTEEIIQLKNRINSDVHTIIPCKVKIISSGELLPEDWVNKTFETGTLFHKAIDNLEARINKPPVTYLANYCMEFKKENKILETKNINLSEIKNIWFQDIKTKKFIQSRNNSILEKNIKYLDSYVVIECLSEIIYILYSKEDTFNLEIKQLESNSIGFNVSLMQKSFRRGIQTYDNLKESIEKLSKTKPYNNPEYQYELVSGSRQLFWRYNISVIEDIQIYESEKYLDIFDFVIYTYIFGIYPKYVVNPVLTNKLIELGEILLHVDKHIDFNKYTEDKSDKVNIDSRYELSLGISNKYMYGMSGDKKMIRSLLTWIKSKPKLLNIDSIKKERIKNELYKKIGFYAGLDLHCSPQMIIQFQNALYTFGKNKDIDLETCSGLIWEHSSSYNYRKHSNFKWTKINDLLYLIQYMWVHPKNDVLETNIDYSNKYWDIDLKLLNSLIELNYQRTRLEYEFTSLKYKKISFTENIITPNQICQTILSSQIRNNFWFKGKKTQPIYTNEQIKFKHLDEIVDMECDNYQDMFNSYTNYLKNYTTQITKSNYKTAYIDSHIYINNIKSIKINKDYSIEYLDGVYDLISKEKIYECDLDKKSCLYKILDELINCKTQEITTFINYKSIINLQIKENMIINTDLIKDIPPMIKQIILSRVLTSLEDKLDRTTLIIGSIDRSGKSNGDSVDSKLEGYLLRIFNVFAALYGCFERITEFKFVIKTKSNIFGKWLELMGYNLKNTYTQFKQNFNLNIIKTKLWSHQIKVRDMIVNSIVKFNQRGFGDASEVGSGKTLTALSCIELINRFSPNSNYLILVPNTNLYTVWEDEIKNHCFNISCFFQEANGTWTNKVSYEKEAPILWVSTMGRNRDHQLIKPINLVIIDECLSVQNKESKWTMKAFEQVVRAKYGVLMLSATFFRTRFDKLFFMLKMLCTGLPTKSEYLDTILNTAIGANIKTNRIKWDISVHKINPGNTFYEGYEKNKIADKFESYIKLKKYLDSNINWEQIIQNKVKELLKLNRKILLYAESETQIDSLKEFVKIKELDWGFYPDISKDICVISKHKGTYGINNLIKYDTIVIKPPEPDKLPQIKGRLDRPGQLANKLYLEYIIIENTIEEIDIIKLELSNNFYKGHIMPLANYYDKYC